MTTQEMEQVYDLARIHEQHIVSHLFDGDDHDTHGWVPTTITDFDLDSGDETLAMTIELPWGEEHEYSWDCDNLINGPLSKICDAYGHPISQFERLKGNTAWVKVRYVNIEGEELESGSRMHYPSVADGPNYWWKKMMKRAVIVVIILIMLALWL